MKETIYFSSYSYANINGKSKELLLELKNNQGKFIEKTNGKTVQKKDIKSIKDLKAIKISSPQPALRPKKLIKSGKTKKSQ